MSIRSLYPDIRPSFLLDFANAKQLDPRITFTRNSTATYVGRDGLIKTAGLNQPRFDHDPVTLESLGLLIEEQRTNLWTSSSDLTVSDNPVYGNWNNATRNSNVAISPDGLTEGDRNTFSTATASTVERFSATAGTVYTFSIYLKKDPTSIDTLLNLFGFIVCWSNDGSTLTSYAFPDLVSGQNASDVLTDEWKRFSLSYTCPAGATSMEFGISNRGAGTSTLSQAYSVLCWGAQIEAGSFATSYIPTSGSAATRVADNSSITGANFSNSYNPSEGTLVVQGRTAAGNSLQFTNQPIISINAGNTTNRIIMFDRDAGTLEWNVVDGSSGNGSGLLLDETTSFTGANDYIMCGTYKNGAPTRAVANGLGANGTTIESSGKNDTVNIFNQMDIGNELGTRQCCSTIKRVRYYPLSLSDDQIKTLVLI